MRQAVFDFLKSQGINYRLQEHEAVFTVAESSVKLPEKVPENTLSYRRQKAARLDGSDAAYIGSI
ncbi:hypothetical protein IPL68_05000 [Candidatus Saccharibacteria bacterium]|nr:MAG: hypothetical protein IPL68_05000 [Candidatus Saccharibacteria bacterium]